MPTIDGKEVTQEFLEQLIISVLDDDGSELHNPIPKMELIGSLKPRSLQEQIQRCMQIEINRRAMIDELETLEDSMDFDVDDEDPDPISEYEYHEMKEETPNVDMHRKDVKPDEPTTNSDDPKNVVSDGTEGDNPSSN